MLIRRLVLENFGLFKGRNEIDLAPRSRNGVARPVVLVGGKNGAGKTTLLEAVRLCLYGQRALGNRAGGRQYDDYLRRRIHRDEAALIQLDFAAVGLQFEYSDHGATHLYEVERAWQLQNGDHIDSALTVLRDGVPLEELDRENADEFLRDLIPPGVSQLYFFDGEKIQELAETDDDDLALAEAIRGLLGLDLVERLHGDLRTYASRSELGPNPDPIQNQLKEIESRRAVLNLDRVEKMRGLDEGKSLVDRYRKDLALTERRLAKEGGAYASKRDALEAEKKQLQETIAVLEGEIRSFCEELLPFALAAPWCRVLRQQILSEESIQRWHGHEQHLKKKIDSVSLTLDDQLFSPDCKIGKADRAHLKRRVLKLLDELTTAPDNLPRINVVHHFSDDQRCRMLSAIERVLDDVPRQLKITQGKLEKATRRLSKVEQALKSVPDDGQVQPLFVRINELNRKVATADAEAKHSKAAVDQIDIQLKELEREERKLETKLATAVKGVNRRIMIAKVRSVLDEYAQALTSKKSKELSESVARRFAQLWRKGDVVRRIEIDSLTFKVTLHDRHDRIVPKQQLSAGEKQIYAISMLWGLAEVSGRPLPMVIDTPLGRLDADHRSHLVERYFPHASHQVIILSTDTEIDKTYFQELAPAVSHSYRVQYDVNDARSTVEKGYFWKRQEKDKELAHAD